MKIVNILYCVMCCTQLTISCLYFLIVTNVSSMPTDTAYYYDYENSGSGSGYENHTLSTLDMTDCVCDDANLTVHKNFLLKWLSSGNQHSISKLSNAAHELKTDTDYLQTIDCDANYNLNLTYHSSQNITHVLLKQFYNGYVLHRRFIEERLLVQPKINKHQKQQLKVIKKELEHNVARIYYLLNTSGCDCLPDDCDQANKTFELLKLSTDHCFHDGNYPINSVAFKIRDDARDLHCIIKQLRSRRQDHNLDNHNVMDCSFNFTKIKSIITTNDDWCNY